jgi:hypothetical protein
MKEEIHLIMEYERGSRWAYVSKAFVDFSFGLNEEIFTFQLIH